MEPALVIAGKDIRRGMRSRSILLMAVVGPLALGLILALAFGGDREFGATIAVVDRDGSPTSRGVVTGLRRDLGRAGIDVVTDVERPQHAVRDGRVQAALVLPAGYGASLAATPVPLQVITDADELVASQVVRSVADEVVSRSDLIRASVATALAAGARPGSVEEAAAGVTAVVRVQVDDLSRDFDAMLYFGPLSVFLLLAMGSAARSLVHDQRDGILDRVRAAPLSSRTIVVGASLGVLVQALLAALVVYLVSTLAFRARWGAPAEVLVVLVSLAVAVSGVAALIVGLARTEAQAEGWNNALAFLFGILGGSFFAGASLPGVLGAIGSVTPNGLAMDALIELGPGGRSVAGVWYLPAALLGIGAVCVLVGARLLERRLR